MARSYKRASPLGPGPALTLPCGWNNAGPYGGYACSNASHIHHHGEGDSVYMQVRGQGDFYRELRDKGFFINDRPARPNRALVCAPRTLNDTGHSRVMLSLRQAQARAGRGSRQENRGA